MSPNEFDKKGQFANGPIIVMIPHTNSLIFFCFTHKCLKMLLTPTAIVLHSLSVILNQFLVQFFYFFLFYTKYQILVLVVWNPYHNQGPNY